MKNTLAKKSLREQLLLFGLVTALVFGGYMLFRVKPLVTDIANMEDQLKSQNRKLSQLQRVTKGIQPSQKLESELKEITTKLEQERTNLEGFDVSFVNLGDQEAKHALIANITLVAEKNRLQILGKQNEVRELTSLISGTGTAAIPRRVVNNNKRSAPANVNSDASQRANSSLKRHVFKLQLRGTFFSTYDFIKSLQSLEHSVLITRIKLVAEDNVTYQGQRLVTTNLTLAI